MSDKSNQSSTSLPRLLCDFSEDETEFTISQHDDEGTMGKCVEINDLPRHKRMRSESNEGEGEVDEEGFITVNRRPKRLIRSSSKNSEPQIESNMPVTLMDEKRNDEESETVLTEEGEEQNGRTLQKKKKIRKKLTTNRDQDIDLLNMEGINNNIVENQNYDKKEEKSQKEIRRARTNSWQEFCTDVDGRVSSSEMWNKNEMD
ncbi:hypothetical protein HF086_008244 [Spodoptera exigua]|uniref:Uncharacterized protein n=1 Tax=Spodoptera exigua TaxID=7107 RepID=A0A922MHW4_SPOEX|nr:hypothetical protein HF086_008244 [Spodoptera exigua]